jgi:8-oxo-dGTP diphosphatase
MDIKDLLQARSEEAYRVFLPHVSIDCVVFGFHESSLKVLLLKMKGMHAWGLPGGYVLKEESIEDAAIRILHARTGADRIFLQQFKVFSDPERIKGFLDDYPGELWNKQRFITIGFYALIPFSQIVPVTDEISEICEWKDIDKLPDMMMDHRTIFDEALRILRYQLNYQPIGYNLLPHEFTMPELLRLYEIILDKKLDRSNFQRKIKSFDILTKLNKTKSAGAYRSPHLYSFDIDKYQKALERGLKEEW